MNAFKCVLVIHTVHQRFHCQSCGDYVAPDIRHITVPTPVTFANGVWSTEQLPVRNREV